MKEADIRPEALLNRYLELSAQDAERCFSDTQSRVAIPCVACGGTSAKDEFVKNGFAFSSCLSCGTLYQSPRPSLGEFKSFYRDSESSHYWADVFFPAVAETRRGKIFRPRVEKLSSLFGPEDDFPQRLIEVGAGYGIFLDEWRTRFPATQLLAIEPGPALADNCRLNGFSVIEDVLENTTTHAEWADLVVCFEVLEHAFDPLDFVRRLSELAIPGGHVLVTTLGIDGFDIGLLWEKSNSIFPPHHINFPSIQGFHDLFTRAGLVDVHVSTPGVLDVDIVSGAIRKNPALLESNHFLKPILAKPETAKAFQHFLTNNNLSSHTWIFARKPGNSA